MKLGDLLAGISAEGAVDGALEIRSLSYDSRTVEPGALFVALRGQREDGGRFIPEALARGAAAVVCETPPQEPGPWIIVKDTRLTLAELSANWFGRPGEQLTLIGVTGTNGKTTTTTLLWEMLSGLQTAPVGLIGTNRVQIGSRTLPADHTTPESYELQSLLRQMVRAGCRYAVMEVSSHALMQRRTAGLVFAVGAFTNLTQDHLDYHGTMESYRAAKGRLFSQCRRAVLNLDDPAGRWYRERVGCPVFTYSENRAEADLTARNLRLFPGHVEFEALTLGQITRVHLPIPGGFSIYNALAALSVGLCLGLNLAEMARVMRTVRGVKGRVELVPVPRAFTVLIDYAHSPNALENILMTARDFTAGRLICLFGCGGNRDRGKRPMMGAIAQELADLVIVTSDNPRDEDPEDIIREILAGMTPDRRQAAVEPDRRAAIGMALAQGRPGDVIVLAGKGHETWQEIRGVRYPMDEREIVADWFHAQEGKERAGNLPVGIV